MTARLKEKTEDLKYRIYLTDALKTITENTAKTGGKAMKQRYAEIIQIPGRKQKKQDTRTGEEIAADIISKISRKGGT